MNEVVDRITRQCEIIREICTRLKKYCHRDNCGLWNLCPRGCEECSPVLGLDTGLAWIIAKHTETIIDTLWYNGRIEDSNIKDAYVLLAKVEFACNVLELHLEEYEELYTQVNVLKYHIVYLIEYFSQYVQKENEGGV